MEWYESSSGIRRYRHEESKLSRHYPGFELCLEEDGRVTAIGYLGPNDSIEGIYLVYAVFPERFGPGERIQFYLPEIEFPEDTPHHYGDGEVCLTHGDWTAKTTLVDGLGFLSQWLTLFENFVRTGEKWG